MFVDIEENLELTQEEAREFRALGVLLNDNPKYIDKIENFYQHIGPQCFYTERQELSFKQIYDVMRSLYVKGEPANITKIAAIISSINKNIDEKTIETFLKCAKVNASQMGESLETFCNAILDRHMITSVKSLGNSETSAHELAKRMNELVNDYEQSSNSLSFNTSVSDKLDGVFQKNIDDYADQKVISTGFIKLDCLLGAKHGLLPERLYIIGAVSSLGKTTFAHQMADNIAAQGTPVLFFSLEQSETELISKSIVREQFKLFGDSKNRKHGETLTTVGLLMQQGTRAKGTNEAIEAYRNAAKNVYIFEGNFNTTFDTIAATVKKFKRITKQSPVVFIDYLQLVKPSENDNKARIKDTIDATINGLKVLARDEKLPVVAISSFNRSFYNQTAAFGAFKESGSIEYSADTVMALQLQKLNETQDTKQLDEEKAKSIRKIELVCLKNRGGQACFSDFFDYAPKYEYFREREKDQ